MQLIPDLAIAILRAGGGLRISTRGLIPDTMIAYARAAAGSGAKLTFVVQSGMIPETLINVARAGGGNVVFDVIK